jgi:coniferyl-aldehyde dehydrogenase
MAETFVTVASIKHMIRHVASWMKPERRGVPFQFRPGRAQVVCQPLGVVGVISPWNYPVSLALGPVATALAAGNRVMLKPSEYTPATSALLVRLLGEIFPADQVTVVTGDAEIGAAFAALPFDHLLFTGGTATGRLIMRAASENLVPVTLELGGKSPVLVDADYPLERAARRIAQGKRLNAGQVCIAPDYVLVPAAEATRARPSRKLPPTLLLDVTGDMAAMQDEIFGSVLPVKTYGTLDEAIAYINSRPRPLALYYFGASRAPAGGPGPHHVGWGHHQRHPAALLAGGFALRRCRGERDGRVSRP